MVYSSSLMMKALIGLTNYLSHLLQVSQLNILLPLVAIRSSLVATVLRISRLTLPTPSTFFRYSTISSLYWVCSISHQILASGVYSVGILGGDGTGSWSIQSELSSSMNSSTPFSMARSSIILYQRSQFLEESKVIVDLEELISVAILIE
ncbi:hypothetical protein I7I53_08939 [Histoplasma capsulatum var. duboisii H88]|uniref:Uncharacterized protein n=1 Tax=Ajellomyces capsulatus (strain H88) TaxID=544711 RepID=A0A8A1L8Q7_AJEC8|nr:hypothetical protein I7I53_08939 [Histoplasma capsulatum var. duboisii H88]